jgi:5'-nucleotidase
MATFSSRDLANHFDGIDIIIDGHSHTEIPLGYFVLNNDYQTLVVQTGSSLHKIENVDLLIDSESGIVVGKRAKPLNSSDLRRFCRRAF